MEEEWMPRKGWKSTNIRESLYHRVSEYADKHEQSIQEVVEQAIKELIGELEQ